MSLISLKSLVLKDTRDRDLIGFNCLLNPLLLEKNQTSHLGGKSDSGFGKPS